MDEIENGIDTKIINKGSYKAPVDSKSLPAREEDFTGLEIDFTDQEAVTSVFRRIWLVRQTRIPVERMVKFNIPECTYTKEELIQLKSEGRRVGYLPDELDTEKMSSLMRDIWPELISKPDFSNLSSPEYFKVRNETNRSGWFDYEVTTEAPNAKITERQIRKIKKKGRQGLTANQYIVASQDSKLLTGEYLDPYGSSTRLLGSTINGIVAIADFSSGRFNVSDYSYKPIQGYRFAGVPKKT